MLVCGGCKLLQILMGVGLRTLVVATATVPESFYEDWKHTYYRASTSLQNRQRNLDEAAELIERVCNTFHVVVPRMGKIGHLTCESISDQVDLKST